MKDNLTKIPEIVAQDEAYQNAMKNSDKQNARLEHDKALQRAITKMMSVNMEIFREFNDNQSFKNQLSDAVFSATYNK